MCYWAEFFCWISAPPPCELQLGIRKLSPFCDLCSRSDNGTLSIENLTDLCSSDAGIMWDAINDCISIYLVGVSVTGTVHTTVSLPTFRMSGDPVPDVRGPVDVEIALSTRAERRLYTARLDGSVCVSNN